MGKKKGGRGREKRRGLEKREERKEEREKS